MKSSPLEGLDGMEVFHRAGEVTTALSKRLNPGMGRIRCFTITSRLRDSVRLGRFMQYGSRIGVPAFPEQVYGGCVGTLIDPALGIKNHCSRVLRRDGRPMG